MAKSWSGFQPQNELVKLYWQALEISQSERHRLMKSVVPASTTEPENAEEDPEPAVKPGLILLR